MTSDELEQRLADQLRELARQVRWMRHAIERLLALVGLLCGMGVAIVVAKIILGIAG